MTTRHQTAKKRLATALLISGLFLSVSGFTNDDYTSSYAELDSNIVKAYNSNPRNTALVYVQSVHILKKAEQDTNTVGAAWRLKAQKLITVACFYECTKAIDRKLYRQAYIWAQRGIKQGTTFGKIGDTPVNNLYCYLTFADSELQNTPMVKNSDPNELQQLIDGV